VTWSAQGGFARPVGVWRVATGIGRAGVGAGAEEPTVAEVPQRPGPEGPTMGARGVACRRRAGGFKGVEFLRNNSM
jgi:hypothetical protein